jgi:hypothetical protein
MLCAPGGGIRNVSELLGGSSESDGPQISGSGGDTLEDWDF